jgi:hypothetical protein
MREYHCKYPLKKIVVEGYRHYKNLLRDAGGIVISENITCFRLEDEQRASKIMMEMESKVKEYCPKAEVVYDDANRNRWISLIFNGKPSKIELDQMQEAYQKVYDPKFIKWRII